MTRHVRVGRPGQLARAADPEPSDGITIHDTGSGDLTLDDDEDYLELLKLARAPLPEVTPEDFGKYRHPVQ